MLYDQQHHPEYTGRSYTVPTRDSPLNSLAIASMVVSLLSLLISILAPIGAIMGHVALRQIDRYNERGRGMAMTGVIIGWINVVIMLFVLLYIGSHLPSN